MECRGCGATVDAHGVFPGGAVRCASCGAESVVPTAHGPSAHDPYREAQPPEPEPPLVVHSGGGLGPLCPRCTRLLVEDLGREGSACTKCGGVFVSHATLASLLEAQRPPPGTGPHARHAARVPGEDVVRYASCPECSRSMSRMNFGRRSGIVVDACRPHGTWFDRGELEAAIDFVRSGGIEDDVAEAHERGEGQAAEAARLEGQLEVTLRAETNRQVEDAAILLWATGNLVGALTGAGWRYPYRRRGPTY
jgi:Zn-finger nucleic acid-binding protein